MSLKDLIARDTHMVFLNVNEFCDNLTIQIGTKKLPVIGSLQQNQVQNNSGNGSVLQKIHWTLYVKYPLDFLDDLGHTVVLSTGTRLTINNQPFSVVDVSDEMGLATINLTTTTGG